eukprot:COSAG02_NODE_2402_length_8943_cov_2.854138_12_plen_69_part_00
MMLRICPVGSTIVTQLLESIVQRNVLCTRCDSAYPTDVGTAITGESTSPATTLGNAPSIPGPGEQVSA